uniref:C2H2-type domain-containing protein n=1 Tax=Anopheles farauti TaxID=69004 RepID=A0A182QQT7_9DIPT
MEQTSDYLKPLDMYGNECPPPYYQYIAHNDQMKQSNEWTARETNVFGTYGSYPVPFGAAGKFDWNGCYDPITPTSLGYGGVSAPYGSTSFVDISSNYHQQQQQTPPGFYMSLPALPSSTMPSQTPLGSYMPLPSPASSSAPSPTPSQFSTYDGDNAAPVRYLDSDLGNNVRTDYQQHLLADGDCTTPFLTPPYEQVEETVKAAPKYASLLPQQPFPRMESTTTLPYVGHSVDAILLQLPASPQAQPMAAKKPKPTRSKNLPHDKRRSSRASVLSVYDSGWRCELCDKAFVRKMGLTQHNNVHHSGERPHPCLKCGKRFADPVLLERHINRHQSQNKPHKCDQCPKQFMYRMDLRRHQYKHFGNAPHQCAECGKGFARRDHMLAHEQTHLRRHTALVKAFVYKSVK